MRPKSLLPPVLVAAVVAVAALVFAENGMSSGSSAGKTGASGEVEISNYSYSPATTTVKLGTTVTFTNEESVEHTATSDSEGVFDTGTLAKGQSVHVKLNKVGTFTYHCSFHAFMHGTLEVVG